MSIVKADSNKFIIFKAAMFIMIILLSGFFLFMYVVNRIEYSENKVISEYREMTFDRVWAELKILREESFNNAEIIAKNIEEDLRKMDLPKIQSEFDNGIINNSIYDIFINNIENVSLNEVDNYRNGIIIMTQNGIVADFNYDRAHSKKTRTWDEEIDTAWNKKLEEHAIEGLLMHDTESIIATEKHNELDDGHIKISEMTKESLKMVYDAEGIDGLKNYQFKTAAYITETGDIFGKEDIYRGIKQDNHKIIVVQEFNLYDQIMALTDDLTESERYIQGVIEDYALTTNIIYCMGIFYIISIIVFLFYFSQMYNYYLIVSEIKYERDIISRNDKEDPIDMNIEMESTKEDNKGCIDK